MYEPGKIAIIGGGGTPPVNSVELIDLNQAKPAWTYAAPMSVARRQINATIWPDGRVMASGGTSGSGFNNPVGTVMYPEVWDPPTNQWTKLAPMAIPRLYHSSAVLLPDGRIVSGGGGEGGAGVTERNIEMYSPPYLFKADGTPADRPVIAAAPDSVGYGATFTVQTAQAADVAQVTLIRLPTVTHGSNFNQRFVRLSFTKADGALAVTAPAGGTIAPPGHYYLFILDSKGVPSVAKIVQLN
jgi:hypothetical protein